MSKKLEFPENLEPCSLKFQKTWHFSRGCLRCATGTIFFYLVVCTALPGTGCGAPFRVLSAARPFDFPQTLSQSGNAATGCTARHSPLSAYWIASGRVPAITRHKRYRKRLLPSLHATPPIVAGPVPLPSLRAPSPHFIVSLFSSRHCEPKAKQSRKKTNGRPIVHQHLHFANFRRSMPVGPGGFGPEYFHFSTNFSILMS